MTPTAGVAGDSAAKYEILRVVNRGGMGEIALARVKGTKGFEKLVILKRLRTDADREDHRAMFDVEGELMSRIEHPNIVQVFDQTWISGVQYLAMAYIRGRNLDQVNRKTRADHERISDVFALTVMAETLRGLAFVHRLKDENGQALGVVHQDITPSNILVSFFGEVKITDFGIAYVTARDGGRRQGVLKGKPRYVAPEVLAGRRVNNRADIYGCGVVLYELLAGRALFARPSVQETLTAVARNELPDFKTDLPDTSDGIFRILQRALAKDPQDRYRTAEEMHAEVAAELVKLGGALTPSRLGYLLRQRFKGDPDVPEVDPSLDALVSDGVVTPSISALPTKPPNLDQTLSELDRLLGADSSSDLLQLPQEIARELASIVDGDPFEALTPIPELVLSGPNGEDLLMRTMLPDALARPPLPPGSFAPPGGAHPTPTPPAGFFPPQSAFPVPTGTAFPGQGPYPPHAVTSPALSAPSSAFPPPPAPPPAYGATQNTSRRGYDAIHPGFGREGGRDPGHLTNPGLIPPPMPPVAPMPGYSIPATSSSPGAPPPSVTASSPGFANPLTNPAGHPTPYPPHSPPPPASTAPGLVGFASGFPEPATSPYGHPLRPAEMVDPSQDRLVRSVSERARRAVSTTSGSPGTYTFAHGARRPVRAREEPQVLTREGHVHHTDVVRGPERAAAAARARAMRPIEEAPTEPHRISALDPGKTDPLLRMDPPSNVFTTGDTPETHPPERPSYPELASHGPSSAPTAVAPAPVIAPAPSGPANAPPPSISGSIATGPISNPVAAQTPTPPAPAPGGSTVAISGPTAVSVPTPAQSTPTMSASPAPFAAPPPATPGSGYVVGAELRALEESGPGPGPAPGPAPGPGEVQAPPAPTRTTIEDELRGSVIIDEPDAIGTRPPAQRAFVLGLAAGLGVGVALGAILFKLLG